jgi:AraC-like DNA-binding protein
MPETNLKIHTDDTLRETVDHGTAHYPFSFYLENIWQFDFHCIDWHWHHELEMVYVQKGSARCFVDKDTFTLQEGEGAFVNSGVLHRFEATADMVFPNIVFSPSFLSPEGSRIYEMYIEPIINASFSYQVFSPKIPWQRAVLCLLVKVFKMQETHSKNEIQTLQLLLQLWNILVEHLDLTSSAFETRHVNPQQAKLHIMMQFIQDHYKENITLDEIADSASSSKSGALHIFKTGINSSPVAYLIQYRLIQAAEQLCKTEKSIASIAEETGFNSAGYFCRKFKYYFNMTPNEYKRSKLKNSGIDYTLNKST